MKKILAVAGLATIGFAVTAFVAPKVSNDSTFEGVITYSISVDDPQAAAYMQGSTLKIYMKQGKVKTIMEMSVQKITTFSNDKTPNDPTVLLEVMGNKYQVKTDPKNKDDDNNKPAIKYTDGTKTIAGYNCKKAEVTSVGKDGQSATINVYYTEDLPAYGGSHDQFKGLKGFPLEYSVNQQGKNLLISATKVDKSSFPDDAFTVPSGYKLMTSDEIQADVQKQMSGGN